MDLQREYIVTCIDSQHSAAPQRGNIIGIGLLHTPPSGKMFLLEGSVLYMKGIVIGYDSDSAIEIVQAANGLSQQIAYNKYGTVGPSTAPRITRKGSHAGDQIFVAVVETDSENMPEPASISGQVKRVGYDISSTRKPARIYTDIPFRASYLGAPVLNASEALVGIICGSEQDNLAVALPAQYVSDVINTVPKE